MKNKKGFTLIELLAVIVILAIIALIATPIILNMIEDARKSAAVDSAYGYIKAIDYNNSMAGLNSDKYDKINSGPVTEINNAVKVKGTKPTSGDVDVDTSGRVIKATLCINGYNIEYKGEKATATDTKCGSDSETEEVIYKCKRATSLHTEECTSKYNCGEDGYTADGTKGTTTITYGSKGTSGTLTTGDAYDCDVDGDGTYDAENERFYYLTDMNSNTALLTYYNNTAAGVPNNSTWSAYHAEVAKEEEGPVTARDQLPTTKQWPNVSLTNPIRAITDEKGGTVSAYTNKNLPSDFSYEGKAARLLTYDEINRACYDGTTSLTTEGSLIIKCQFLLENTMYTDGDMYKAGTWLETRYSSNTFSAWYIYASGRSIYSGGNLGVPSDHAVRPVIEVSKQYIEI